MHFYMPEFTSFWQWLGWFLIVGALSSVSIVKVVIKEIKK